MFRLSSVLLHTRPLVQTRAFSHSARVYAGFGQDKNAQPAKKSTLSDAQSASGSDQHEAMKKSDIGKAGSSVKPDTQASGTADPASAKASSYNADISREGIQGEQGGTDLKQTTSEINKEQAGGKMSGDPMNHSNLREKRGVST